LRVETEHQAPFKCLTPNTNCDTALLNYGRTLA